MRYGVFALLTWSILSLHGAAIAGPTGKLRPVRQIATSTPASDNPAYTAGRTGFAATSAGDTTWLYSTSFNAGGTCSANGWTTADLTAQVGTFWHVEDYAGLSFGPVEGSKSLWCGARPDNGLVLCSYQTLPGFGNNWNQMWCTKDCLAISGGATSNLDVALDIRYDCPDAEYDFVALEYTNDCSGQTGWTEIDGGHLEWTGTGSASIDNSYSVGPGPVKVRLRFESDTAWSDEDGGFPSVEGAAHVDNLKAEDLPIENFEDEATGATMSDDWQSCNESYGNYAGLFSGTGLLQEDGCTSNLSCMWAFIQGSTVDYSCGGHAEQAAVPYANARGEYISNEIWSPLIAVSGSGSLYGMTFDVYRDDATNTQIYYTWRARAIVNGCPTKWSNAGFVYGGLNKSWFRQSENISSAVASASATHLQVALGIVDLCELWCTGPPCHSHAPLFDNVSVFRVNTTGPQWSVRAVDLFQDTFSTDGTITGTARADAALDIRPATSPSILAGDSAVILSIVDPVYVSGTTTNASGLTNDPNVSTYVGRHKTKKQVYLYVAVWPLGQPDKTGAPLSEGPGGQSNRYPFAGTVVVDGVTWTMIRMDYTYQGTATNPGEGSSTPLDFFVANRFNVDLNDNVFEPGDTICYFFSATSPGGTNYYSDNWHVTDNLSEVAANPMEFTILPAGGWNRGGDMLYVDAADGLGVQPYYDGALLLIGGLGDLVDRYDVRSPSSAANSTLAGRVVDIQMQLNDCYQRIFWDCGSLPITLGDGTGAPLKTDDVALINSFLGNLTTPGGFFLAGDDVAENLAASAAASVGTFTSVYMPFGLLAGDHIAHGLGVSPSVHYWPGRCYVDDFFVFGGCPELNDFDVLSASGTSQVEMTYGASQSASGAVVSNINGNARVILAGFSFAAIRDDELNGVLDRAKFFYDTNIWLGGPPIMTAADGPALSNRLDQNYPNPFNPTTTIAFSIKSKAHVDLAVYDVSGRLVRRLANETRAARAYTVDWDGRDNSGSPVASGVYFYRLVAGDFTQTRKMVLLK